MAPCLLLQGVDVLFYGDSILETFEGQQCGADCVPRDRCKGGMEAWEKHFAGVRTHILAVCGAFHTSACCCLVRVSEDGSGCERGGNEPACAPASLRCATPLSL